MSGDTDPGRGDASVRMVMALALVMGWLASFPLLARTAAAPQRPVTTTYYGDAVTDPYRWMEARGPEFLAWVHTQNAVTRAMFASLPGYAGLAAEVAAASDAEIRVTSVQRVGDRIYFQRQGRSEAQPSLYVRLLTGGPERRLVDPARMADATTSITDYAVSPDNRMLAFSLSGGGSEEAVLHLMQLDTGRLLPETIDRARAAGPVWSGDGTWLFYNRLKAHAAGPPDRFFDETVFRHRPGDDPDKDTPIFNAVAAGSEIGTAAFIGLILPPGAHTALAFANSGVSNEAEWFAAPLDAITASACRPGPVSAVSPTNCCCPSMGRAIRPPKSWATMPGSPASRMRRWARS